MSADPADSPSGDLRKRSNLAIAATGALLLALAAASYGLSFVHSGAWGLPLALGIAALKAGIVISVFMELRREAASVQLAAATALLMMLLLVALTAADVATRTGPTVLPPTAVP
jgi:cytochrome c oxidase subunit 4